MKEHFQQLRALFAGQWAGEGFAKFPTITSTAYTEQLEIIPDEYKDSVFFRQKTWYKNDTEKNGHTVFWDTGFVILKEDKLILHSVQVGGRIETYQLSTAKDNSFTFDSTSILDDPKSIRSQRIFTVSADLFHYELNMATHQAEFQHHLGADLRRAKF